MVKSFLNVDESLEERKHEVEEMLRDDYLNSRLPEYMGR
jgi:hypothetical protein